MLIDSHCHLSELSPTDLQVQLQAAKEAQVQNLIAIGAGYEISSNYKTLAIAKEHAHIFCALAMHPHDAKLVDDQVFADLEKVIRTEPKVRAVGEIGLDYHYMQSDKEVQQEALIRFTRLAQDVKKPIVVHDRDCEDDCVDLLRQNGALDTGGVVHCFTGSKELAFKYLDLGFLISFTGIITFKNAADLREVVKAVPLDRMMVETDSPFLAPVPHRGKPNQPAYVKVVAEAVADLKGLDLQEVANVTTQNAQRLFNLS